MITNLPVPYAYLQLTPGENSIGGTIIDANPAFEAMVGLGRDKNIGQNIASLLPELNAYHFDWLKICWSVITTAEPTRIEVFNSKLDH